MISEPRELLLNIPLVFTVVLSARLLPNLWFCCGGSGFVVEAVLGRIAPVSAVPNRGAFVLGFLGSASSNAGELELEENYRLLSGLERIGSGSISVTCLDSLRVPLSSLRILS